MPKDTKTHSTSSRKNPVDKTKQSIKDIAHNYLLLVCLTSSDDPTITELLSVPATYSYLQLHQIIKIAFEGKAVLSMKIHEDRIGIMFDVFDGPDT
ncbi:uncharacterized protein Bfra_004024 [Botrytis fragariae]|uniref:Uncharacterized protein n=1 Tax=Botrytis fragariae TaxID=1964551 RepID=A0A8H6AXT9_9HELO|nr:uncharacterized protein Bfra_004024 [Botrytis fragariae]KAF5875571.1 hypothetical protein Bfra_004024 [Botrytis fragariae]